MGQSGKSATRGKAKILTANDVLDLLRAEVEKAGSQRKWASENGVDRTVVCRVLGGFYKPQNSLVRALGLKKVVAYARR
jgi:hypothetical protein